MHVIIFCNHDNAIFTTVTKTNTAYIKLLCELFHYTIGNVVNTRYAFGLNFREVYIRVGILNKYKGVNDRQSSISSFLISKRNSQ